MAEAITGKVVAVGDLGTPGMDFGGPVVAVLVGTDCARRAAALFGSHVEISLGEAVAPDGDAALLSPYERIAMWHEEQAISSAIKEDRGRHDSFDEKRRREIHREAAEAIRKMVVAPTPPAHEVYERQLYILRHGLVRAEALIAQLRRELEEADS